MISTETEKEAFMWLFSFVTSDLKIYEHTSDWLIDCVNKTELKNGTMILSNFFKREKYQRRNCVYQLLRKKQVSFLNKPTLTMVFAAKHSKKKKTQKNILVV
jgi:3-dehydroquinate dehydratase